MKDTTQRPWFTLLLSPSLYRSKLHAHCLADGFFLSKNVPQKQKAKISCSMKSRRPLIKSPAILFGNVVSEYTLSNYDRAELLWSRNVCRVCECESVKVKDRRANLQPKASMQKAKLNFLLFIKQKSEKKKISSVISNLFQQHSFLLYSPAL